MFSLRDLMNSNQELEVHVFTLNGVLLLIQPRSVISAYPRVESVSWWLVKSAMQQTALEILGIILQATQLSLAAS